MKQLCIIPCGKKKVWDKHPTFGSMPAKDVYLSTFHRLCRAYAMHFFDYWVILSAKHGFLFENDIVDGPYDITFNGKSNEIITINDLQEQAIEKQLYNCNDVVVLTGKKYVPIIHNVFPDTCSKQFPLLSYGGIGVMQQKLKVALEKDHPIHLPITSKLR
ncbi:hypothetical protein QA612_19750 [Evansella sp. AB-P1]|uniref:DUF6884 domain-containing protein n=1 Tax=Evansella sp. AB-P1 TaxID=3037653 RepID=UPI00241CDD84|nr:DUF6884 domain-containing protein [Evansella sp. AB-P1]MDG5789695.1 hypothetical protein [Evansella sp. AB-P1]